MDDKRFDLEIRRSMEDFKVPYRPDHWEMMQSGLDSMPFDQDEAFDELIGEKLGSVGSSHIPAHWDKMANMLDEHSALSDAEFDEQIASRLNKVRPPYNPDYWNKMETLRANRRERVIQFALLRTTEVMMLLLLWFYWPVSLVPSAGNEIHVAHQTERTEEINKMNVAVEKAEEIISPSVRATESMAYIIAPTVMPEIVSGIDRVSSRGNMLPFFSSFSHLEEQKIIPSPAVLPLEDLTMSQVKIDPLEELDTRKDAGSIVAAIELPRIDHTKSEKKVTFSPYISADFSAIDSYMSIEQLEDNRLRHLTLTPGVGLGVGFHNGPWSVQTGAAYAYKFYDPNITEQFGSIDGYAELNFNQVSFHVLQLPIRLQYEFLEGMKNTFYVTGGASLHYIVRQDFDKPKRPISSIESIPSPANSILDGGKYRSGSFLGRFHESSYVTADIGIGIERDLGNELVFYIQPTYMRMFGQGVGPNYDVIHSVSLQIGLRL